MGKPSTHCAAAGFFAAATLSVSAWTPGVGNESATSGFSVDTQSRNDVISFWHCVYMQSEGYEARAGWTGSVTNGIPGTTAAAFKDDVQRRVNYYRAMAGMTANIAMTAVSTVELGGSTPAAAKPSSSTTKRDAAQRAALMRSKNHTQGGDPHNPPGSWSLDGAAARNGAFHSSLSLHRYGPDAIDAYVSDDDAGIGGAANDDVAHRRYLFHSRIQEVATGDVTGGGGYPAANALYVSGNLLPAPASPQFIPWPNAGYIPEPILPERWSLSFPGADFSSATVTMTDINGSSVPLGIVSRTANFADSTIVWKPASMPSADFDDQVFNVTVANIVIGGTTTSRSYQVTVINPDRLLGSTDLSGSASPPDSGAQYFFEPVEHAEGYELEVSSLTAASWLEGAEDGTAAHIVDDTDPAYDLRTAHRWNGHQFWDTGGKAFRLAFPANTPDPFQSFLVNRTLIPGAGASLTFRFRRGYMANNTRLSVQSSVNGGASWTTLAHYSGTQNIDPSFSTKSVSLASAGQNTLVRFVLHQPTNTGVFGLDGYSSYPIGAFIDGITPVNCDTLEALPTTTYAASAVSVPLNAGTGGGPLSAGTPYILRLRAKVGCRWFSYGSSLQVTPVAAASLSDYELWHRGQYAIVGSFTDDYDQDGIPNGVERVFGLNPLDGNDAQAALHAQVSGANMILSHPIIPGETVAAECSATLQAGSWSPVNVTISGGVATATAPLNGSACFVRWVLAAP